MAKITWTFTDESGDNLNRYIATNVTTGEKITFDLLRGGTIKVAGTPLNKATLDKLITAINEAYDEIKTNATGISTNKTAISTNATNISTNKTNIATNTSDISTLKTSVATNKTNITTNTSDISTLKTSVSTNTTDITNIENGTTVVEKAKKDSNGNVINDTYLNKKTGGTINSDLNVRGELSTEDFYADTVYLSGGDVFIQGNEDGTRIKVNGEEVAFSKQIGLSYEQDTPVNSSSISINQSGLYAINIVKSDDPYVYYTVMLSVESVTSNYKTSITVGSVTINVSLSYAKITCDTSGYIIDKIRLVVRY